MTSSPITSTAYDTHRRVAGPVRHRTPDGFELLAALLQPRDIAALAIIAPDLYPV
jgi:hypothetical protein